MQLAYKAYCFLSSGIFLTFFPLFWFYTRVTGRYRNSLSQRLGLYPDKIIEGIDGFPRIWLHAASVGEVGAAVSIIESLYDLMPDCAIILSTTTEQGQAWARNRLGSTATCIYAPIDFVLSARKALRTIKPDILVCLETEIWPNWLLEAWRMGIKTALVNGRISVRSIKGYVKIRPLIKEILRHINGFSMISETDAQRIIMMGAPPEGVEINGNAKYDLLMQQANASSVTRMRKLFSLKDGEPVFVAGSTRTSEEEIVLDVYEKIIRSCPDVLLIIAPRHLKRVYHIKALVEARGFTCQLRSRLGPRNDLRTAPVVIMDTIGDLRDTYSIASVVFCGGSLVPKGGQNILEPAVWGKPVLYGPSMEDFLDAKELLEKTGGGIQVNDGEELAQKALYLFTHPDEAGRIGKLAQKAVRSNQGAADKHAGVIYRILNTMEKTSNC
ncbi:MAG: 3-deoxy-D-manno-octulosonic acid transferase [Proteobacteria bacterium]|nr:3-deoxy-D-manno-octulosonic acid transferase [Pseudomonadota bacterium]